MQIIIIRAFSFDSLKKIVNFEPDYKGAVYGSQETRFNLSNT